MPIAADACINVQNADANPNLNDYINYKIKLKADFWICYFCRELIYCGMGGIHLITNPSIT